MVLILDPVYSTMQGTLPLPSEAEDVVKNLISSWKIRSALCTELGALTLGLASAHSVLGGSVTSSPARGLLGTFLTSYPIPSICWEQTFQIAPFIRTT